VVHDAALRAAIVPAAAKAGHGIAPAAKGSARGCGHHPWAELLKRVFAVDVLRCPDCGGRRRIIASITQGSVIRAILATLGLPTEAPTVYLARGPPGLF
jgi:hypothetical protein